MRYDIAERIGKMKEAFTNLVQQLENLTKDWEVATQSVQQFNDAYNDLATRGEQWEEAFTNSIQQLDDDRYEQVRKWAEDSDKRMVDWLKKVWVF